MVYAVVKIKFDERCKLMQKKKKGVVQNRRRQYQDFICDIISHLGIWNIILNIHMESTAVSNS